MSGIAVGPFRSDAKGLLATPSVSSSASSVLDLTALEDSQEQESPSPLPPLSLDDPRALPLIMQRLTLSPAQMAPLAVNSSVLSDWLNSFYVGGSKKRKSAAAAATSEVEIVLPATPTHLSLAGGKFAVPDGQMSTLYEKVEVCFRVQRRPFYLVEMRTPVFPSLWDFDLHCAPGSDIGLQEFCGLVRVLMLRVLRPVLPYEDAWKLRCIISSAPLTAKRTEVICDGQALSDFEVNKRGYHLIFPDVLVDQMLAFALRRCAVKELKKAFGDRFVSFAHPDDAAKRIFLPGGWEDFVDESVIKANGLRMLYANKGQVCRKHTVDNERACPHCNSTSQRSYLNQQRPYQIDAIMDGNGHTNTERICEELSRMQNSMQHQLHQSSVRRPSSAQPTKLDFDAAGFEFTENERKEITRQVTGRKSVSSALALQRTMLLPGDYAIGKTMMRPVPRNSPIWNAVKESLKRIYGGKTSWRQMGLSVLEDLKGKDLSGPSLWDALGGEIERMAYNREEMLQDLKTNQLGSGTQHIFFDIFFMRSFCVNVGREHGSNRTGFWLRFVQGGNEGYRYTPRCFSAKSNASGVPCNSQHARKFVFSRWASPVPDGHMANIFEAVYKSLDSKVAGSHKGKGNANGGGGGGGSEQPLWMRNDLAEEQKRIRDDPTRKAGTYPLHYGGTRYVASKKAYFRPYKSELPGKDWHGGRALTAERAAAVAKAVAEELPNDEEELAWRVKLVKERFAEDNIGRELSGVCGECGRSLVTLGRATEMCECDAKKQQGDPKRFKCARCGKRCDCNKPAKTQCQCKYGPVY